MTDTIDRRAALGALAGVPTWAVPVVAMATPVDPIFTAVALDRIAYVAFVASVNRREGQKAAQEKRSPRSQQPDEDAYETAWRRPGRMLLVKPRG
jgi:hypothetical protein